MCKAIISILCILFLSNCATLDKTSINGGTGPLAEVVVHLSGIQNDEGYLLVFMHDNEHSYFSDDDINTNDITFFKKLKIPAAPPQMKVTFENIPTGSYAVTAYHDEDDDGRVDRMIYPFMGMPSESYGTSNEAFAYFSKGDFQDALIAVKSPHTEVNIVLNTHLGRVVGY